MVVEVLMTLFGKLLVNPQIRIMLLRDVEVNHVGQGAEVVRAERWASS